MKVVFFPLLTKIFRARNRIYVSMV